MLNIFNISKFLQYMIDSRWIPCLVLAILIRVFMVISRSETCSLTNSDISCFIRKLISIRFFHLLNLITSSQLYLIDNHSYLYQFPYLDLYIFIQTKSLQSNSAIGFTSLSSPKLISHTTDSSPYEKDVIKTSCSWILIVKS